MPANPVASTSAASDLIDSRVSSAQVDKAVHALVAHATKQATEASKTELLDRDDHVWLTIGTKKISSVKKLKPAKIALPYPLVDPRTTSVCLITKDPQRFYKDLLEEHRIKFVGRVVGLEKLRGKFKPFEARRQLMNEHGLFLVDERVVPLLPKLLGTKFFKAKKQPIPVNLTRKDLKGELERAISSTYFHHSPGNSHAIRIASLPPANGMDTTKVAACLKAAIGQLGKLVPGGWENVSALNIKTASSVALPVWVADPAGRWTGMEDDEAMDDSDDDSEAGEDDVVEPTPAPTKKAKAPAPVKKTKKPTTTEAKLVAPAPPHPAPVPTVSKVESKKKTASAPADKKKVSGQSAGKKSIKESVVGKKGGPMKK